MKVLVTGGGGFLGRYIVEQLLARGDQVRMIARSAYPELEAMGVKCFRHDLSKSAGCEPAMDGLDVVIHTAAKAGAWGHYQDYYENNVLGTQNCLQAAIKAGVPAFVYTSSPSVVFGDSDLEGVDGSYPYPQKYLAHYPATKAMAEKMVLSTPPEQLLTCSLRPHLIFGPRDPHLTPRLLSRVMQGKLPQVGDGTNKVDISYVENVAAGHIMAADALKPGSPLVGKAYFISQNEPVLLWQGFIGELGRLAGAPPIKRKVSLPVARFAGYFAEKAHDLLNLSGDPSLTPFLAAQLATSHWFDQGPARRDFGYDARIPTDEGLRRTVEWLLADPRRLQV